MTDDSGGDELDPRVERSRRVIGEAALAEMAEVGYGALTVEGIAKRAGVSKATIYRQWSGKLEVIGAALDQLKATIPRDELLPPRDRVVAMLAWMADHFGAADEPVAACFPAMVSAAQYDPAVREFHHRFAADRRQVLVDTIVAGQQLGQIDAGLDPRLTAELLVGPIFYRRLMTDTPFPADQVDKLVDTVLGPP
ncbi:MAG: TetR/AcrR family transcriptional regulator [Acidimicrobiales bacterium]